MIVVSVDIPRTEPESYAKEIFQAFTDLGWSAGTTGYLPDPKALDASHKVRNYMFSWNISEVPVYPEGIEYTVVRLD